MADNTQEPSPSQLNTIKRGVEYIVRTQRFLSGDTLAVCSCGEMRVFPNPRMGGKCPRGTPFVCMAQQALPALNITIVE